MTKCFPLKMLIKTNWHKYVKRVNYKNDQTQEKKAELTRWVPFQTGNDLSVSRVDGINVPGVLCVYDMDHVTDI